MTVQTAIKTTDLDAAPMLDEVLGHRMVEGRKRTVRMPVNQLITQLKAGGAATIGLSDLQPEVGTPIAKLLDWIAGDLMGMAEDTADGLANEVAARVAAIEAQAALLAEQAEAIAAQAEAQAAQSQALADEAATRSQALTDEARDRAAAIAAEQADRVAGAFASARAARATMSRVSALGLYVRSLDYTGYERVETLQRELTAAIGETSASIREQMTVAASETAAIAERVVTLEASTADLSASIIEVETARVADNEAFAQRLAAISIGSDTQFDPARTWTFDTGVEGWTGSPAAPVASNGWLRPADASAAPYIMSPSGLAILGSQARQVRALAQRKGAPVWVGRLWWRLAGQTAWDSTQSVIIAEPVWSTDGEAQITWRPDWAGTIDAIRLDLTGSQSATDAVRLDYVAIGSPSPGASRAELLAEQRARIAADETSASRTDGLTAELAATRQDLTGTASAVQTLTGAVTEAQDTLTAQAGQLATISAELDDKASSEAVDELESKVEALTGTTAGLVSQSKSVRAIRASLQPLSLIGMDAAFGAYLAQEGALQATAEAAQTMTSKVEATNNSLSIVSDIVSSTRAALSNKAETSTVDTLSSRLTTNESRTTATSAALQQVTATVNGKADASVVNQIEAEVDALSGTTAGLVSQTKSVRGLRASLQPLSLSGMDAAFGAYLAQEGALQATAEAAQTMTAKVEATNDSLRIVSEVATSTRAALAGKAETSALDTLKSEVTAQDGRITAQSQSITSLRGDLNGKASGAALASLTQTVSDQGGQISLQGQSIASLSNDLNGKASGAALASLTQTVTSQGGQIAAQGQSITSLRNDVDGKASGAALASLTQTVTDQGGQIAAQGQSITSLRNDVDGKASGAALASLTQTVTDQGGQIAAQGQSITSLRNDVDGKASGAALASLSQTVTDQGGQIAAQGQSITSLRNDVDGKASGAALASLTQTVTSQGGQIAAQGQSITSLRNDVDGKASGAALASLSQTVTDQGGQIAAQGQSITSLRNDVDGKASGAALASLTQTVTSQGGQIAAQGQSITSLRNDVDGKASGAALASLTQTVTDQGGQIAAQGQAITSLRGDLNGKASSGALSALTQTVSDQGGQISANAGALIALDTRVGNVMAGARYKMEVVNGPAGYVRIGALAAVTAGNQFRTAGWYIDQPIDETQPSQFVVDAGRFVVVSGSDKTPVFVLDGSGRAVFNAAVVPNLTTDKITFGDGSVQTRALAPAAAQDVMTWDGGANGITHEAGITVLGTTPAVTKAAEDVLEVFGNIRLRAAELAPANAPMNVTLALYWGDILVTESYIELMQVTARGRDVQIQGFVAGTDVAGTQALQLRVSKDVSGKVFIGQRRLAAKRLKRVVAL